MTQLDRRQALKLMGGLGVATLATACSSDQTTHSITIDQSPARIGILAPQTGPLKVIGEEITNGLQLYLDLNGGRLGPHPVQLVKADEGDTVESGLVALEKLLSQRVHAIVGVANSALLVKARDLIQERAVPVLAANGTPLALRGAFYIWSTSYAEHDPGMALGPYVAAEVGKGRQVAIVAPSTESGQDAVEGFRSAFGADAPPLAPPIWTPPTVSASRDTFEEPVRRLVELDAAAVFCYYAGPAAVEFVRALRQSGSRAQIYAPGMMTEGTVLAELGSEGEGILTAMNYSADVRNTANRRFTTVYRRTHGFAPSAAAVGAYDAAQVVEKAIQVMGKPASARTVYLGLDKVGQIESPRGLWQFNFVRTPSQRWYLRKVQRDGPVLSNVTLTELATLG